MLYSQRTQFDQFQLLDLDEGMLLFVALFEVVDILSSSRIFGLHVSVESMKTVQLWLELQSQLDLFFVILGLVGHILAKLVAKVRFIS